MRYGIVRHKQAVFIGLRIGIVLIFQRISIHCTHIGERHIVHCFARQSVVHRAGDARCRQVEVVSAAGSEAELLVDFIRGKRRRRQQRQHHAAQQQDAEYSFLHWLFSSFSCRFGLSVPSFFGFLCF